MTILHQPRIPGLPKAFTDPFHEIYIHVTRKIEDSAVYSDGLPSGHWIQEMVTDFAVEYKSWETNSDYDLYFKACNRPRLSARFLHLTVCAFLHISYDLPVVMARKWPGIHDLSLTDDEAEDAFFELEPIFPAIFLEHGRSWKVVRWEGIWVKPIPNFVVAPANQVLSHWTGRLRAAAWIHARRLSDMSLDKLNATKIRMMQAMVTALGDLTILVPWSPSKLQPPYGAIRHPEIIPLMAVTQEQVTTGAAIIAAVLSLSALLYSGWRSRQTISEMSDSMFVDRFARLIRFYTDLAIQNPEAFDQEVRPRFFAIKRLITESNGRADKNPE